MTLKKVELNLLDKGLTFVPTPKTTHIKKHIQHALRTFTNRIFTKYFFSKKPSKPKLLYRTKQWKPPIPNNRTLKAYIRKTKFEINRFIQKNKNRSLKQNLNPHETKTLKRLSQNKNIEIKPADKGGALVIMNKTCYKSKVFDHLNDEKSYELIKEEQTSDLKTNIEAFLTTIAYHYHIDKNTFEYLIPPNKPRIGLFYITPKIHKPKIPGRPIVSAVNSVTENISEFLTKCVQPLTLTLKSFIKDTKHFLQKTIDHNSSNTTYLVTFDIKSLYTNIPHEEGIEACLHYINKNHLDIPKFTPNNRILHTLFLFILENNYFEFKDRKYKQKFGTSMGTRVAPSYATLFLGKMEEDKILIEPFKSKISKYSRFLDDIFLLWNSSLDELLKFEKYLNNIHPTIKFTMEYSTKEINFLDTTIYIDEKTSKLKSKVFIKPTDARSLLHY
eukprot:TCONS_00041609-protein